jgi:hypothetical protein
MVPLCSASANITSLLFLSTHFTILAILILEILLLRLLLFNITFGAQGDAVITKFESITVEHHTGTLVTTIAPRHEVSMTMIKTSRAKSLCTVGTYLNTKVVETTGLNPTFITLTSKRMTIITNCASTQITFLYNVTFRAEATVFTVTPFEFLTVFACPTRTLSTTITTTHIIMTSRAKSLFTVGTYLNTKLVDTTGLNTTFIALHCMIVTNCESTMITSLLTFPLAL